MSTADAFAVVIDLRHESVANLFDLGWTLARVAAALDLTTSEAHRLDQRADVLRAQRSTVCARCGRRVRGASPSVSLRTAFKAGWDHTGDGHLRCNHCLQGRRA